MILGGDFNTIQSPIDRLGSAPQSQIGTKSLKNLKDILQLIDIWRTKNPNKKDYTWRTKNAKIKSRLDYFLISKSLETKIKASIQMAVKTDHKAVTITIKLDDNMRGPNFWKLNQTLLNDAVYTENITNLINDKWKQYSHINDLRVRWDLLKFEIQTFSMKYAKNKAKERKQEEMRSWETVNRIDKLIIDGSASQNDLNEYETAKQSLETIETYRANGEYIRSRVEFIEQNEKSTTYFYNTAKQFFDKKTIHMYKG